MRKKSYDKDLCKVSLIKLFEKNSEKFLYENLGDAHSIGCPKFLIKTGFPKELINCVTRTHKSDPSHYKSIIYVDGKAVDKLEGVRMEALLSHIASIFNYRLTSRKYGRGSAHREELNQLIQNLKKDKYLQ
jgi:hypothetical protein